MKQTDAVTFFFVDDGSIPNNPSLPVLFYKGAMKGNEDKMEETFNHHHWLNSWTNGIFDYHHFHSNAHEVLGVISGHATVRLGGRNGQDLKVDKGDVILLPAGTGHKRIEASDDFKVCGAYPEGMEPDIRTGKKEEHSDVVENIKEVPLPLLDPVFGENGPVKEIWIKTNN